MEKVDNIQDQIGNFTQRGNYKEELKGNDRNLKKKTHSIERKITSDGIISTTERKHY